MKLVSVVIPCYNPTRCLEETLASVRAQTHAPLEIILVNDGSDHPESLALLHSLAASVDRSIEQENRGLAAARNAGFRTAQGEYVLPLDADDRIEPSFVAECAAFLDAHPEAAFICTDYRVFGDTRYVERLDEYNLYHLLDQNTLIYAALIRREDWALAGGYDDSMRLGYEDWDFWLRLAEQERFGLHLPRALFEYRKSGRSLLTVAREHHQELVEKIRANHPQLYSCSGRARVKAQWAPAVCVLGAEPPTPQTIEDCQRLPTTDIQRALGESKAEAFLIPAAASPLDAHSAELCALAVWGGHASLKLPDGARCLSRRALAAGDAPGLAQQAEQAQPRRPSPSPPSWPRWWERLHRHLLNAELTSLDSWRRRPLRSLGRLIPLRVKERINRAAGRPVFDLSFYLRFQPRAVLTVDALVEPLRYLPRPAGVDGAQSRIALLTPHLGPGGAESVLLQVAAAVDRRRHETFLIATQSQDATWRPRWEQAVDHVYDVAALVAPERMIAALYSMAANWQFDALVIQNSLAAYSALPRIRREMPSVKIIDLVHAVDEGWDFVSATAAVAGEIDARVVISQAGRERLRRAGVPEEKIRLIRNGIDLQRFGPAPLRPAGAMKNILFAGRLDPIKRPLLLVEIAAELARLRPAKDFRFVVAGAGPEAAALRARLGKAGLDPLFEIRGQVEDIPAALAGTDVVVIPSQAEGIPLIALEAFAVERPVVCSQVGAAAEVVNAETGVLIEPGPAEARRFAEALPALLEDRERRARMGRAGRRKVEAEYSRERAHDAYRDLLATLLAGSGR
ncbi:MAG TPA: glycosyltransferase [Bryobacterales bacterium]|nr:glycosyltransferase [Bryobacterales bacterium]